MTDDWYREDDGSRAVGWIGLGLTALGTGAVALALTTLHWQDRRPSTAADLAHPDLAGVGDVVSYFAIDYFGGLGWVFVAVTAVAAMTATLPTRNSYLLRLVAVLTAFVSAIVCGDVYNLGLGATGHGPGFYLAVAGFALMGIGGAIGPRRVRERPAGKELSLTS